MKGGYRVFPNLYAEMARRKITQVNLAERVGRTPTTMSLKLRGESPLTLTECIEIKNAIDETLSVDYLFATKESR
jgi:transcriptional regulator with XRE-family HTH domain